MDDNFDFYCGVIKCVIGAMLIFFGLIGWPATRFIIRLAAYPITRQVPQKPIGSKFWDKIPEPQWPSKPSNTPFWDKYKDPNWMRHERGFVIAPVLYVLGLIGVVGGVLFSNNMQVLKSTQSVQSSITVKSDLQAAANTLSAQGVFSTNGMTLCPPRSTHQTTGNPCVAAPVSLVQFADFTGGQLPANYASAGTTGSPTEVGVFAAGSGLKVLDAYGHTYIYCRWENPRSSPASNAFVLLSAGADGKLQTKCGDTAAQGDDMYLSVSVATAINRAALWQANGTSNVSYGATGTQVTIDSSGDLTTAGNLVVTGTSALNSGLSVNNGDLVLANTYSYAQIDSAGTPRRLIALSPTNDVLLGGHNGTQNIYFLTNNSTVGWFNVNGDFDAYGSVYTTNVNASNTVNGVTGTFTNLNTTNATVTGTLTVGAITTNSSATIGGGFNVKGGDITLGNGNSFAEVDNSGNARRLIALDGSNNLLIGGRGGTQGIYFYGNGNQLGSFDTSGDLTIGGNLFAAIAILTKYNNPPASCSASNDGAVALTALYTLCVCKNGTGWVTASTGSTSCTW